MKPNFANCMVFIDENEYTMLDSQYAAVAVPIIGDTNSQQAAWALSYGGLAALWDKAHLRAAGEELLRLRELLQPALAHAA